MGKREFYGWVAQLHRERKAQQPSPHSWGSQSEDDNQWWKNARQRRAKMQGRV